MNLVLPHSRHKDNAAVAAVWANIEQHVTLAEAEGAVAAAVAETLQMIALYGTNVVYGWSGGKDSVALQVIMRDAGVSKAVIGSIPKLEFPEYLDWCHAHKPDGLVFIENDGPDMPWLTKHPKLLFPQTSQPAQRWTMMGTRRAQHMYVEEHKPDLFIMGRRRADGNWFTSDDFFGVHVDGKGMRQYSPTRDWSHELNLAVIHYNGLALPPIYDYPQGWVTGTSAWPGRRLGTVEESWALTWQADPGVVGRASAHFAGALQEMTSHA